MANTILTPVTLWKDFDDSLPLEEEIVEERDEQDYLVKDVYFLGRQTAEGRVKIFSRYFIPKEEERYPVVMILFEAGKPFDQEFVGHFLQNGYGVLCVDYCGESEHERYTLYPQDVDYANYRRAGRAMEFAEPSAKETSWYEWAGVARYAVRYLTEQPQVSAVGGVGMRTGGEILFKIAPYAPISCMISVCAAGWLAYRDLEKFSADGQQIFDEERHRFIAGVDSQSYAPYVKCPVLLLSAINDKKYRCERVYDTFRQINQEVEKAILFSAHGNGIIGGHSLKNVDLFFDKYLKDRSIFISAPISFTVGENEAGNLVVKPYFDENGEIAECGLFYSEEVSGTLTRDWTRVLADTENFEDGECVIPLNVYNRSSRVLVYIFVCYSNGFSTTSSIREVVIDKEYPNSLPRTRVIYTSQEGLNGFTVLRRGSHCVADCFSNGTHSEAILSEGFGGIMGVSAQNGIISYRVDAPRFAPDEGASMAFDVYCEEDALLNVAFYKDAEEKEGYVCEVKVSGGGKWKNIVLDASDFKTETGLALDEFIHASSVGFTSEKKVLINNIVWL